MLSAVRDDRGRRLLAVHSIELNRLCATFIESHPVLVVSIFVREFLDESLDRKSSRFPEVLITILSSELMKS